MLSYFPARSSVLWYFCNVERVLTKMFAVCTNGTLTSVCVTMSLPAGYPARQGSGTRAGGNEAESGTPRACK